MNQFYRRVCDVKDLVVRDCFLDLKMEIRIDLQRDSGELLGYGELTSGGYYVDVDSVMRRANVDELYGGMAHEIAQIYQDAQRHFLSRKVFDIVSKIGTKYGKGLCYRAVVNSGRDADLLIVEKGMGESLLAFLRFHQREYPDYRIDEGLSISELEKILSVKKRSFGN
jgi:hypothetical protein